MKAVSNVITVVILLLVTVVISGLVGIAYFTFATDIVENNEENAKGAFSNSEISILSAYNEVTGKIIIQNVGKSDLSLEDLTILINGTSVDFSDTGILKAGRSSTLNLNSVLSNLDTIRISGPTNNPEYIFRGEAPEPTPAVVFDHTSDSTYCVDNNPADGDYLDSGEASFSGTGTSSDPYQIFSPCQLHGVRYDLSASYELMANISMTGFDSDTNSANGNWIPVGNNVNKFTGTFDGNNNTISGIVINLTQNYVGLFGFINNSSISDVGVTNVNFSVSSDTVGYDVGALAGHSDSSNISNSYSTGNISGGFDNVGGLVGVNDGPINNSYSTVDITNRSKQRTGGLVGRNLDSINNSYATGDLNSTSIDTGGLVGVNFGTINNSSATGIVNGTNSAGGFAGGNSGSIDNSYATGNVIGTISTGGFAGGNSGSIDNSSATGDVSGDTRAGGFAGSHDNSDISDSYSTGDVSGNSRVGGLVGSAFMSNISNSYSTSNVNGTDNVGGAVGFTNTVNISNSYATGNVNGTSLVGGLVGHTRNTNTFTNSYAIGSVTGTSAGGAVGDIRDTTTCPGIYWDTTTSGVSTSACGTGQTTSQLQMPTSNTGIYSNWLTSIWNFGTSSEYPRLVWE